jgi:hypothetical protein
MRIYNLTDVATPNLERNNLVNKTLAVWVYLIQPGESMEVVGDPIVLRDVSHYIAMGAMSMDSLPAVYVIAKDKINKSRR